jgi:tryptophanyl-tRNA synthetase
MSEPVANLFYLLELLSTPDTVEHFRAAYNDCSIRYGDLKKQLAEDIITFTTPIRERILDIYNDDDYLRKVVKMGAEKARESASKTVREVRDILGYKKW